jgi:mono/diheme cytochrome c family protein
MKSIGFASLLSGIALFVLSGAAVALHAAQPAAAPLVPAFADKARIPASGKQGPPAEAAMLAGNWKRGEALFTKDCRSCHGPQGTDKVPNPGSDDGTVPPLKPIDPELANKNPSRFAANIDRYIQHGSIPTGPHPALFMPNWGDSRNLSQQAIADLEAYIMRLNGVRRQ